MGKSNDAQSSRVLYSAFQAESLVSSTQVSLLLRHQARSRLCQLRFFGRADLGVLQLHSLIRFVITSATAARAYHFLSAGITYHGACLVLVAESICS